MKQTILICVKKQHKEAELAKKALQAWAHKKKINLHEITSSDDKISGEIEKAICLGVAIGGDGTFLSMVKTLTNKEAFPLMGVNLGSLGFITEFSRDEMLTVVELALKGKLKEDKRPVLDVEVWRKGKKVASGFVFNDAVISKSPQTTMLRFDVSLDSDFLNHVRADGYIVSTPTGSTAYALSAGGPMVHPEIPALELVPICSHSLSSRPILVPLSSQIIIEMKEPRGKASLVYDGQLSFDLEQADIVKIKYNKKNLRLLHAPTQKWSEALREKLGL
ncbi:MAG: NAD(+)/NADH kinase [Deltaproteobacteria bacterium]|jgi:NAD+ kinase